MDPLEGAQVGAALAPVEATQTLVRALGLLEAKLNLPRFAGHRVPRTKVLRLLDGPESRPIVVLHAPPGYGKTTLLAEWAAGSDQPFACLTLDQRDNDPATLMAYLTASLSKISIIDPALAENLASPGATKQETLSHLASALAATIPPFCLALDDFHRLTNPESIDVIDRLIDHVPEGGRLIFSGHSEPTRLNGRLRARGRLLEIGPEQLRMEDREAASVLDAAGVKIDDPQLTSLVERTEGWPAGLYLAALAIRSGGVEKTDIDAFHGSHRFVAELLWSELLSGLSEENRRFLTRTSVLRRLSGPLCDAVLEADGSAAMLEELHRSNHFVVPLDPDRHWYRYHQLFRETLRAELERTEPRLVPDLLGRAADWCSSESQPEIAADYAREAQDVSRLAGIFAQHALSLYRKGRAATIDGWAGWLEEQEALELWPPIAAQAAMFSALQGRTSQSERWAEIAARGVRRDAVADGDLVITEAILASQRAYGARGGVRRAVEDAEAAVGATPRGTTWWPMASFALGLARLLDEDLDSAAQHFADATDSAAAVGASTTHSAALAERALLRMEDDWVEAEVLTNEAMGVMRRSHMEEYPTNAVVYAAAARLAIHRGEAAAAARILTRAMRLLPHLTYAIAAISIQARLQLARAYAGLADVAGARTLLREAMGIVQRGRGFGILEKEAAELAAQLESVRAQAPGASSLTTAELRLLPLLPTHLSFREIGERLHLSRHTIKSQAISTYRKIDVTTRTEAVERARELGLL